MTMCIWPTRWALQSRSIVSQRAGGWLRWKWFVAAAALGSLGAAHAQSGQTFQGGAASGAVITIQFVNAEQVLATIQRPPSTVIRTETWSVGIRPGGYVLQPVGPSSVLNRALEDGQERIEYTRLPDGSLHCAASCGTLMPNLLGRRR
jgi:uncharacterized membrane protein